MNALDVAKRMCTRSDLPTMPHDSVRLTKFATPAQLFWVRHVQVTVCLAPHLTFVWLFETTDPSNRSNDSHPGVADTGGGILATNRMASSSDSKTVKRGVLVNLKFLALFLVRGM